VTILKTSRANGTSTHKLTMAQMIEAVSPGGLPVRFTAFDGSTAGPEDAPYGLHLKTPRGASYIATAPGDLGMARAYVAGDLDLLGVHPGDPYDVLRAMGDIHFQLPPAKTLAAIARSLGVELLKPPPPPPQ
jgi:cyclopropane-fatty-acyl-phospholipid synthase